MNNFALEIWDDECRKCTFYTVRWDNARKAETDKFFEKYYAIPGLKESTQELLSFVLDSIGNDHGAIDLKWMEACQFAKRIDEALRNKEIIPGKNRTILSEEGDDQILL